VHEENAASGSVAEMWDARYREGDRIWSGRPNQVLVAEVQDLPPGRALDLGCGEGGDAIWLAGRGWRVTGADVSGVALERAARHAADAGVADRIAWERHDLALSLPQGEFELVNAQYLHSPAEFDRDAVLRRAAALVAVGGRLLVTGHAGVMPHRPEVVLPTAAEVLAGLALPPETWRVLRAEEHERPGDRPSPGGHVLDSTVLALRTA
jgi:SAM-dependent methyltransferase